MSLYSTEVNQVYCRFGGLFGPVEAIGRHLVPYSSRVAYSTEGEYLRIPY